MSDCDCDKVEKVIDLKLDVINARLDAKDVALDNGYKRLMGY